ncbi:MAG: hypothetical protein H0W88_05360 [Parachlamydiaceae bacterium]|nr:hypothetical protein [Parachlamydiaceae bacterium]
MTTAATNNNGIVGEYVFMPTSDIQPTVLTSIDQIMKLLNENRASSARTSKSMEIITGRVTTLESSLTDSNNKVTTLEGKLKESCEKVQALASELKITKENVEKLEADLKTSNDAVESLTTTNQLNRKRIDDLIKENEKLEKEKNQLQTDVNGLNQQLTSKESTQEPILDQAQRENSHGELPDEIEELRKTNERLQTEIKQLKEQIEQLKNKKDDEQTSTNNFNKTEDNASAPIPQNSEKDKQIKDLEDENNQLNERIKKEAELLFQLRKKARQLHEGPCLDVNKYIVGGSTAAMFVAGGPALGFAVIVGGPTLVISWLVDQLPVRVK